jgi:hypothetical protein
MADSLSFVWATAGAVTINRKDANMTPRACHLPTQTSFVAAGRFVVARSFIISLTANCTTHTYSLKPKNPRTKFLLHL